MLYDKLQTQLYVAARDSDVLDMMVTGATGMIGVAITGKITDSELNKLEGSTNTKQSPNHRKSLRREFMLEAAGAVIG